MGVGNSGLIQLSRDFHLKGCMVGQKCKKTRKESTTKEIAKSSSPGEFHPQALTDPDVTVSRHPALIIPSPSPANLAFIARLLPSLVDQAIRPDDPTPSLHLHYRDFNTTTSWSAPVLRIGTLTLVGSST